MMCFSLMFKAPSSYALFVCRTNQGHCFHASYPLKIHVASVLGLDIHGKRDYVVSFVASRARTDVGRPFGILSATCHE